MAYLERSSVKHDPFRSTNTVYALVLGIVADETQVSAVLGSAVVVQFLDIVQASVDIADRRMLVIAVAVVVIQTVVAAQVVLFLQIFAPEFAAQL